ncbi:hypothetical protein J4G08_19425, partial [Candidatus Poribacteria bacterium]|nr:hypothetical protein [Candidatus Poribacteria bacterium]
MNKKQNIIVGPLFLLLFLLNWLPISFSQEISRPVTYSAEFKPLGDGIDWEGKLPDDFDELHLLFKFKLNPGTFEAEINANINFDQDNQTLGVQPRHVTDLSNAYVGKFEYSGGVLLSGEIIFDFVLDIPFLPDIPIYHAEPIPGFPQINEGWDKKTYFDSLLLKENDAVEIAVGIRELFSEDITAVEIAELLAIVLSQGSLPQQIANKAGDIIKKYIGDGGINVHAGILNYFTLDAMGIYVDGQLITDDEKTVSTPGLNPAKDSYSIQSSFEEKFSTRLDLILTSDVFFNFEPYGIELWSYEKEIFEVPIPILPETELNSLDFVTTPDITTFPVERENISTPNNAPEPVGTIPPQSVQIRDAYTKIDLSGKFTDPDDDTLTFSVATSNPSVLTTQKVGNEITLLPWNAGSTTVTITATDPHGLTTTLTFSVTVLPAVPTSVNHAPTAVGTIADQSLYVGGFSRTIDVSSYFRDPDGDTLTLGATSDNANIVNPEVLDNSRIRITPGANGSATVSVTASDGEFIATQTFSVIVSTRSIITTNRAPVAQGTISSRTLTVGDPATTIDLSSNFRDPDGDSLTYAVTSNNIDVVNAQRTGTSSIRLTPTGNGSTTVTVTVSDGRLSVTQTFSVTVNPSDVDTSDSSDVIVENISVDYPTLDPNDRFTVSATVRNAGGRRASNVRLRYYLSNNATYSTDDEELENTDDYVGSLDSSETSRESANLRAPSQEGVYYIIARTDPVDNEQTSRNNYQSIKITVLPPPAPDLVVSLVSNRYTVDPNQRFNLDATVRNQGAANSRQRTTVRFYSSTDATISADDVEIGSDSIRTIRDGRSDSGSHYLRASEQPGTYYFYARVDTVNDERITDNNDSNVITITVPGKITVINLPPRAQGTIAPQTLNVGTPKSLNVSSYFTDQNNDVLRYSATSRDNNIATAVAAGAQVTITPKRTGNATITITASDGSLTATQTISVTVNAAVSEETWMPDANLRAAVRKTLGLQADQPLTQQAMAGLTQLSAAEASISDISGLEYATGLTWLYLRGNSISDISA